MWGDLTCQGININLETTLGSLYENRSGSREPHLLGKRDPVGCRNEHLIAWPENDEGCIKQSLLCPCGEADLIWQVGDARFFRNHFREPLAQLPDSKGVRIPRLSLLDRLPNCRLNVGAGILI